MHKKENTKKGEIKQRINKKKLKRNNKKKKRQNSCCRFSNNKKGSIIGPGNKIVDYPNSHQLYPLSQCLVSDIVSLIVMLIKKEYNRIFFFFTNKGETCHNVKKNVLLQENLLKTIQLIALCCFSFTYQISSIR